MSGGDKEGCRHVMTLVTLRIRVNQGFLRKRQKGRITPCHCQTLWLPAKDHFKLLPTQEIGKIVTPTLMIALLSLPSSELSFAETSLRSMVTAKFSLQIIEQLLHLCVQGRQGQLS